MTALVIPNQTTFGQMTNSVVSRIAGINTSVLRLNQAVATASADYSGTPGTEFEATAATSGMPGVPSMVTNNFGIQPDPDPGNAGLNGQAYADAVTNLTAQWQIFWTQATPFLTILDNGMAAIV